MAGHLSSALFGCGLRSPPDPSGHAARPQVGAEPNFLDSSCRDCEKPGSRAPARVPRPELSPGRHPLSSPDPRLPRAPQTPTHIPSNVTVPAPFFRPETTTPTTPPRDGFLRQCAPARSPDMQSPNTIITQSSCRRHPAPGPLRHRDTM